uniref:Inositol-1-monophosphatase n=2 Tax=Dunaliella tertiolecta TaxID=3047 RepID=A0A7S3QQS6_DUNTE|mmetsp:Transcript_23834/g.61877  ORF Transcript_23834/g.61877 Transcript_23834/m.61877 type:complete len:368 (+) Transcript_23834:56-1159(+)
MLLVKQCPVLACSSQLRIVPFRSGPVAPKLPWQSACMPGCCRPPALLNTAKHSQLLSRPLSLCAQASSSDAPHAASGPEPLPELLRVATAAAQEGAKVISAAVDQPRKITMKGATDLVTETDRLSEEAILGVISSAYPDHAVLGEEGGVSGNTQSEYLWVVDPIDGTTNFAHSYPSFAVSVGVLHRGTPIVGCVVEFLGGPHAWGTRTYTAHKGGGAFCNGHPIRTSTNPEVTRSLLVTGFGYDHGLAWQSNMELFKELTDVSQGVRRLGAAAVDLCHVALGVVDATWEYQLKPWDVTGGCVILLEAGGKLTTMDGQPYSVFSRSMLASNGPLHPQLLQYTQPKTEALLRQGFDLSEWFVPRGYNLK